MQSIIAGQPLIKLIKIAYSAGQPVMLHGPHGVGKSELFAQAAAEIGIGCIVRDLSLMEPPDLVGIPTVVDKQTHYAVPSFLPTDGAGLLLLEELTRSPRYMQAPCLQLLSARTLNDYELPWDWLPCASVNDQADGYAVDEIDRALLSRFLHIKVVPDVAEWCRWAAANEIHTAIIDFVNDSPGVFADPDANPRAWTYASHLLVQWESIDERDIDVLVALLSGVLGDKWALAFVRSYSEDQRPLQPKEIIEDYPSHQAMFRGWVDERALDVVEASVERLKREIQAQQVYEEIVGEAEQKRNVECFFGDLPPDIQVKTRDWLEECGFDDLMVPARRRKAS